MATILNTKLDLSEDYNFKTIAKLRELKQHQFQPCLDDRFHRARVDYDLLGKILEKKQELKFKELSKDKKDGLVTNYKTIKTKTTTFKDLLSVIKNSVKEIIWELTAQK